MVDNELIEAIMAHNHEHTGVPPDMTMKKGLIACDAASGLVTASALVTPTKRSDVSTGIVGQEVRFEGFRQRGQP